MVGLPTFLTSCTLLFIQLADVEDPFKGWWGTIMATVLVCGYPVSYVIARIGLLVLSCIALRALPPTALVETQWAAIFPHID